MATLEVYLREWTLMRAYELDAITYRDDAPEVIETATVTWPDGATGALSTISFTVVDHQAIPTAYSLTHDACDLTVYQPAMTLDAQGVVRVQPALLIAAQAAAFGVAPFGTRPFGA